MTVEIIGHRGYPARFPENTIPSLLGALDAGADALEWDVHVAACGTPVVFHDATLDRTTNGSGPLARHDAAALARLDAGGWFGAEFAGTPVPTLREALLAIRDARSGGPLPRLYPEIKAVRGDDDLGRILSEIEGAGARDATVLISMDFGILEGLRARGDAIRIGYVPDSEETLTRALDAVRRDGRAILDPDWRLLTADPARTAQWLAEGISLATWTVDRVDTASDLLALGVRRITTNRVTDLVAWARTVGEA